ncbi:MAG: AmmeMemoRadiSam system protein B [Candidatus Promineofilum sp.]|nr:AmmeMemoRadiSam system protein B [Promineifilum sp.]
MTNPRLRLLDFQRIYHQGEPMWLLRDPWQLGERQLIFPDALAQLLLFCDGTRDTRQIQAALSEHLDTTVPFDIVTEALAQLDAAYLLANDRSEARRQALVAGYRAQPHRPPALADLSYPASPAALDELFRGYGDGDTADAAAWQGRGVVSPHIDYQRGGPVYARVWRRAAPAVLAADLVLIFGTDHNGSAGSVTLTPLPYATPYGVLPTDGVLIDRLAAALGPEAAYAEELNHRQEHSVELSAVWLHHVFHTAGVAPCPMVPILVGSFHHFVTSGSHPAQEERFNRFLDTLRRETAGRRVLAVGSVDLAHVGPAFGDAFGMDAGRRSRLRGEDEALMTAVTAGDAPGFYRRIAAVDDRNRICGFSPLYLMLSYLGPATGRRVAYEHCPADAADTSLVSILWPAC